MDQRSRVDVQQPIRASICRFKQREHFIKTSFFIINYQNKRKVWLGLNEKKRELQHQQRIRKTRPRDCGTKHLQERLSNRRSWQKTFGLVRKMIIMFVLEVMSILKFYLTTMNTKSFSAQLLQRIP